LKGYKNRRIVETKAYLTNNIDYFPFTALKKAQEERDFYESQLIALKIKAGEEGGKIEEILLEEAKENSIDYELVKSFVMQENPHKNPMAINVNKNGSYDVGLMQINSRNLKVCGLNLKQALSPRINIKCGIKFIKGEYENAIRLVKSDTRPRSCTGAVGKKDLLLEYTARGYNGGSGFYKSAQWAKDMTCHYARNIRSFYAKLTDKPLIGGYKEPVQVASIAETNGLTFGEIKELVEERKEKKENKKSFWAYLWD
jgi:hypothetical protein